MLDQLFSQFYSSEAASEQIRSLLKLLAQENISSEKIAPLPNEEMYETFSKKVVHALGLVHEKGVLFKDAMGLSEENMEAFYAWGFQFFEKMQLGEAFEIFQVLVLLDPIHWKYRYALATTLHRQKNYRDAVKSYLMSVMLEPIRYIPLPYYHAADCYIQMDDLYSAILMLDFAIKNCDPDSLEHNIIFERSEVLKKALEEKFSHPIKA